MRNETADSGPDSDAMCMTESRRLPSSTTEHAFLAERAADARTAIGRTLGDMKETLTEMAGVRSCAARHPWILTGSAVAVGVVVGAVLTPSARQRIRRTPKASSDPAAEAPPPRREQATPGKTKSFLFSITATVLAAALQPLVQSWFAPAVAAERESLSDPPASCDSADAVGPESGGE
jgi:hypothetical protein